MSGEDTIIPVDDVIKTYFDQQLPDLSKRMHEQYQAEIEFLRTKILKQQELIREAEQKQGVEPCELKSLENLELKPMPKQTSRGNANVRAGNIKKKYRNSSKVPRFEFKALADDDKFIEGPDKIFEGAVTKKAKAFGRSTPRYYLLNITNAEIRYFTKEKHKNNPEKLLGTINMREVKSIQLTGKAKDTFVITMKGKVNKSYSQSCAPGMAKKWIRHLNQAIAQPTKEEREQKRASLQEQSSIKRRVLNDQQLLARVLSFLYDSAPGRGVPHTDVSRNWAAVGQGLEQYYATIAEESSDDDSSDDNDDSSDSSDSSDSDSDSDKDTGKKAKDSSDSDSDSDSDSSDSDSDSDTPVELPKVFVLDHGAHFIKAGLNQDDEGTQTYQPQLTMCSPTFDVKADFSFNLPRAEGEEATWDLVANTWQNIFEELEIDPTTIPVVVGVDAKAPQSQKDHIYQILFERLNVPAAFVSNSSVMAAYIYGSLNGLVVDVGYSSLRVTPIYNGVLIATAVEEVNYLGTRNMLGELATMLSKDHPSVFNRSTREAVMGVALDMLTNRGQEHKLVRGSGMEVPFDGTDQLERAEELFFSPESVLEHFDSKTSKSLPEIIIQSINRCEIDIRSDLFSHVLLCGGGSLSEHFAPRLERSLKSLAPHAADKIKCMLDTESTSVAAWSGGSIMASLPDFKNQLVESFDYQNEN